MPWKSIDPQPVTTTIDGATVEVNAERWDDFTGAIAVPGPGQPGDTSGPGETHRITILAGEYTPVDEAEFERACAEGTRI